MNHSIYRCSQMSGDSSIIWRCSGGLGHCCWQVPWEGRRVVNIWCCFKTHILLISYFLPHFCPSHKQSLDVFLKHSPDQSFIFIKIIIDFSFLQTESRSNPFDDTDLSSSQSQSYAPVCCSLYPAGVPLESRQCFEDFFSLIPFSGGSQLLASLPWYKHLLLHFLFEM